MIYLTSKVTQGFLEIFRIQWEEGREEKPHLMVTWLPILQSRLGVKTSACDAQNQAGRKGSLTVSRLWGVISIRRGHLVKSPFLHKLGPNQTVCFHIHDAIWCRSSNYEQPASEHSCPRGEQNVLNLIFTCTFHYMLLHIHVPHLQVYILQRVLDVCIHTLYRERKEGCT